MKTNGAYTKSISIGPELVQYQQLLLGHISADHSIALTTVAHQAVNPLARHRPHRLHPRQNGLSNGWVLPTYRDWCGTAKEPQKNNR